MRALVVVNHKATTTTPRTLDVMLSALRHDLKLEVAETDHRGHAMQLARAARADELDLVLALGGDGTVNEVVNGLLAKQDGPPIPDLAVVPGGSTNVLARNLGIPADPVEATGLLLDAIRAGRRRPLGLGRLDDRYFTFCAGAGFDADVVRAVEGRRAGGKRSTAGLYARTAVRRFFAQDDRKHGPMTLERPGTEPVPGIVVAIVTNTAPWTYLGRRPVNPTPSADFDRGLDLFALTKLGLPGTLRHVAEITLAASRGARGKDVLVLHDQPEFVLRSDRPVPVQVDGDYLGEQTEATLRAVPRALRVVC
jgi:diacylglycerol kinase family enzyme